MVNLRRIGDEYNNEVTLLRVEGLDPFRSGRLLLLERTYLIYSHTILNALTIFRDTVLGSAVVCSMAAEKAVA